MGAVCAVVAACSLAGQGAAAAAASPAPGPAPSVTARHSPTTSSGAPASLAELVRDNSLSPTELAAQIEEAQRLREDLLRNNARIAAATARLERLAKQANTLLQEYAAARDTERTARAEAERSRALFEQKNAQATEDRRALGEWAFHAYAEGGSLAEVSAVLDSLSSPVEGAIDPIAHLAYISDQRSHALEGVQQRAAEQRELALRAVDARTLAEAAAQRAATARRQLDSVIARQKAELSNARRVYAEQVERVGPISGVLLGSQDTRAVDATRELRSALGLPDVFADLSGEACTGDNREYPNGAIPASGLCPLYGAPGESLRPAAAAAFNALSKAYERDTGTPICVTDSYRSLPEQVAVKATKGRWAATPGRSEHGRGMALDLCGGINSFGSAAHLWMRQNAPLYGWFHPSWAQAGGSLPEPWHWEYAG